MMRLTLPSEIKIYNLGYFDIDDTQETLILLLELLLVEYLHANN